MATSQEFCESVIEAFSIAGTIRVRAMMGEYCVYYNDKLISDLCDGQCLLKRTPTSDALLQGGPLSYPYEGSKQLMHVFDDFDNKVLIENLLAGMWNDLPEKKSRKKNGEKNDPF
ncbi:TfoX/Sxy family protein [Dubosiella newyorkensis]|uniref:Competence protein TfoX n=1 Tax=Dubosiella newyorkensis TaxID=1862672 RepID=A0A1U7NKC7_9FIRM|nr:competence protein TfoX [Dubosiella newyorkensis]MCI9042100.1 competence protein TfoX [Dubosiella newyorkensis]OLU44612.1 competence protein TfoX [Dubosiella newyorkensis]